MKIPIPSVCIILIVWIIAGSFIFTDRGMMYAQSVFAVPLSLLMFVGPRLGYFALVLGPVVILLFWIWVLTFYALLIWTAIDLFGLALQVRSGRIHRTRTELLLLGSFLLVGISLAYLDYSSITPSGEESFDIKWYFWLWPIVFFAGAAFLSNYSKNGAEQCDLPNPHPRHA